MSNPAIAVANWFKNNGELLKQHFVKVMLHSDETDPVRGGINIELEAPHLTASIVVWNKGDISIYILKEGSQDPTALIDRVLDDDEDVPLLLDQYIEEILKLR
jgi:hypothetical protein